MLLTLNVKQITAVKCPEMSVPPGTTRNTSDNTYLTYAHYSCVGDTRMLDGSRSRTILCDAAAEWSDTVTDCIGTTTPILFAFRFSSSFLLSFLFSALTSGMQTFRFISTRKVCLWRCLGTDYVADGGLPLMSGM